LGSGKVVTALQSIINQSLLHLYDTRFAAVFPSIVRGPMSELGQKKMLPDTAYYVWLRG